MIAGPAFPRCILGSVNLGFTKKENRNCMKKTVLTFGLISGAVSAAMMLVTVPFTDKIGFEKGEILGYTTIVFSALMVFSGCARTGRMQGAGV